MKYALQNIAIGFAALLLVAAVFVVPAHIGIWIFGPSGIVAGLAVPPAIVFAFLIGEAIRQSYES